MNPSDPSRYKGDGLSADPAQPLQPSLPVPVLRPSPETPTRSRKPRKWLWLTGGVVGVLAAAVVYFEPWIPAPMAVVVEQVAMAPVTRLLAVNGRIAALHSVDLRPLAGGTLTQILVEEGEQVGADQVLVRIDTAAQDAIVRQAIAGLDAALVAQEQADATYARSLALGANVSAAALEADRRAAQSAMQEVARMTALLEQAQIQQARHTLRAPFSGTIITMSAERGQTVESATVLMTLADLSELVVETDVDEAYAGQISVGQSAVMRIAGEAETRTGQVMTVAGRIDAATGGLALKIDFDTPVMAPIGLTVTANIVVESRDAALTVPRTAIVTDGRETAVFLAQDGVARQQPVAVIDWPAARLIVTDGLTVGDRVIVDAAGISDDQRIRVGTR